MVPTSLVEMLVFVVGACRVSTQFYLMREDQLILLAESNDLQPPGWKAQQFYLVKEGQLTLLTEPTSFLPPCGLPRQFYLMPRRASLPS